MYQSCSVSIINPPCQLFTSNFPLKLGSLAALATKRFQTPCRSSKGRAAMGATGGTGGRLGEDGQVLFVNLQATNCLRSAFKGVEEGVVSCPPSSQPWLFFSRKFHPILSWWNIPDYVGSPKMIKKVPFGIFLFGRIYGWNALEMVFQPFQSNDLTMKKTLMVKVR